MDGNKRDIPLDLERIDAHVISDREYEEIPELTDEDFARGVWTPGPVTQSHPTAPYHLLVDADVVARFKATGQGWERRIHLALRRAADAIG